MAISRWPVVRLELIVAARRIGDTANRQKVPTALADLLPSGAISIRKSQGTVADIEWKRSSRWEIEVGYTRRQLLS